jgi:hypothetical protein
MPDHVKAVVEATRAWRAESDVVLRYWNERLTPDLDAHIISTELIEDFTGFLTEANQPAWSSKTILDRFGSHEETKDHHVTKERIHRRAGLSRTAPRNSAWGGGLPDPGARYMAWLGVKFSTESS